MSHKYFIAYELEYHQNVLIAISNSHEVHVMKEIRNTSITLEEGVQSFDDVRKIEEGLVHALNKTFKKKGVNKVAIRAIVINWKPF